MAINPFVAILAILTITVILDLGPSIPGPETLTFLYDIFLQPTTAINYNRKQIQSEASEISLGVITG
ncbi:hypothetical protein FALCPG4_000040 [Fusarium falciforme]